MRRTPARRPAPTRLRVRRPADFLALIPYLVGFHPDESVVAVFSVEGRVLLTARVDLPPPSLAAGLIESLIALRRRHGADEVVIVGYGAVLADTRAVVEQLSSALGATVREAVVVSGGRWWSLTCASDCCPAEGTPWDAATHPLAAEAVYAGLSARASRVELQRQVAGPVGAEEARLAALAAATTRLRTAGLGRSATAALMVDTVRRCLEDEQAPDEGDCLLLAVLATEVAVRDVAWAMITRDDAVDHLRVWRRTVAAAPHDLALGPLGLLGVAAWIAGDGALQNCCAERLRDLDPTYGLGVLLSRISDRALPPHAWDEMAESVREEARAVAGAQGLP